MITSTKALSALSSISFSTFLNNTLIFLGFFLWIFMMCLLLLSWYISVYKYKPAHVLAKRSPIKIVTSPFVTVIRPLSGVDFKLSENLESSFTQDYPNFELLFSVASNDDPSIPIVKSLMAKYPHVNARLIIDPIAYGVNPKVNNMIRAYNEARYDILWVCDSNVFLNPGCLGRALVEMVKPDVGVVHHLPIGVQAQSFGSMLDAVFLNTSHARLYSCVNFLKLDSCVMGKSCLYRKSVLDKSGGMLAASKFLAEDNWIAKEIWDQGLKHVMVEDLVYQSMGDMTLSSFFDRRSRWTRLRKYISMLSIVLEPLTECVLNGIIASYGFSSVFKVHPLNFFAFHVVTWFALDLITFQALIGRPVGDFRKYMVAWGFREFISLPLFLYSVFGNSLSWRGKDYILTSKTQVLASKQSTRLAPSSFSVSPSPAVPQIQVVLQHPVTTYVVTSVVSAIHFLADILHKSQRNGSSDQHESDTLLHDAKNLYTFLAPGANSYSESRDVDPLEPILSSSLDSRH